MAKRKPRSTAQRLATSRRIAYDRARHPETRLAIIQKRHLSVPEAVAIYERTKKRPRRYIRSLALTNPRILAKEKRLKEAALLRRKAAIPVQDASERLPKGCARKKQEKRHFVMAAGKGGRNNVKDYRTRRIC